jgi:MFS family permease
VPALPGFINNLIPPTPLSRRLAMQSLLFAAGDGTFNTAAAFYLVAFVGLSPAQIGVGLTVAGIASFLTAYPMGRLADFIGPKRIWAISALISALMFATMPFIHGFWAYLAVIVVFEVVNNAGGAGRNAYVLDVLPDKERVATQAFMYSSLNLGFTIGALIAGVALALDTDTVLKWGVPFFALAIGIANSVWITRLPRAPHDERRAAGEVAEKLPGPGALRNVGWLLVTTFTGTLWSNQVLLHTVIPLWLVEYTDSPRWLLAWLFATNTVLCIILPAYTSKGVHDVRDALRRVWWSSAFFVAACAITLVTHDTRGFLTIFLVWLGHVAVTGAELAIGSASWAFQAELMDPERRGEYEGVAGIGRQLGGAWAPALFTFLAMGWHPDFYSGAGWLVIGAIIVAAAAAMGPSTQMAVRFKQTHFPHEDEPEPSPAAA